ncbi:MAG: response regulator transcription factor [Syntrophomonadaceae bacterium]|nr:response regulator transcription factor [Syntrophomonadaceae bacterium]
MAFKNRRYGEVIGDEDSIRLITAASLLYPDVILWKPNTGIIYDTLNELMESCPLTLPIIIVENPNQYDIFELLRIGIRGYLPARLLPVQIASAVDLIVMGGVICLPRIQGGLAKCTNAINQELFSQLTLRELQILSLVSKQASNQEIADELFLSVSTVKTHLRNIFRKLEVRNRNEAVELFRNTSGNREFGI